MKFEIETYTTSAFSDELFCYFNFTGLTFDAILLVVYLFLRLQLTLLAANAFSEGVIGDVFGVGHGIVGLPVGDVAGLPTGLVFGLLFLRLMFIHVDLLLNNLGGDSLDWSLLTAK